MLAGKHGTRTGYQRYKCRCEPCVAAGQAYAREWYRKNAERRKELAAQWTAANKNKQRSIPDDKHGTTSGYVYWKCRCDRCREANRSSKRRYTGTKAHPREEDIPHGTRNKYRRGCRCEPCIDALRDHQREQYRRDPENKRAANKRWIEENQERYRAWQAAHYLANHEENKAKRREYERINREAAVDRARLRELRVRGATVERVSRRVVWERDGGICYLCGEPADPQDWHLEHKIPIVLGGEHSYANVAVSHPVCNLRKGKRRHDGTAYGVCGGETSAR